MVLRLGLILALVAGDALGLPLEAGTTDEPNINPAIPSSSSSDPCQSLYNTTYSSPRAVLACLQTIPFNATLRDNVMDMADAMYSLDIFQYNQLGNSDPLLNQGVDIAAQFSHIRQTVYSSDFDFQNDLSGVMRSLNDGHHAWLSCYGSFFSTIHEFPIAALDAKGDGDIGIYLVPDLPTFARVIGLEDLYERLGLNTSQLAGARVLSINGQSAWNFLEGPDSSRIGTYQDPAQRLNVLLASYTANNGVFQRFSGDFTVTRDLRSNNITLVVETSGRQQRTIVVPWITRWTQPWNYASGMDFFNRNCLAEQVSVRSSNITVPTSSPSTQSSAPPTTQVATSAMTGTSPSATAASSPPDAFDSPDITRDAAELYSLCPVEYGPPSLPINAPYNPQNTSAYLGGRDIQFYKLPNSTTGVMFISTFDPDGICQRRFYLDAILGIRNLTAAGVKHLLIDTSNNSGGSVLLNQALQRLITGKQYLLQNNFKSVLRRSPLSEALVDAHLAQPNMTSDYAVFDPASYRNGAQAIQASDDIFFPGGSREINGKTLLTSDLLEDQIGYVQMVDAANNISNAAPFSPENIVFTGNGLCGSACSSFTNFLIEWYNATAYIATARPSKPIEFQAFAAGQATRANNIYAEADSLGYRNESLLPTRLVRGTFAFAIRASLSPNLAPGEFLQYRSYPAQNRFAPTLETYTSPLAQWEYVANQVFAS